MDQYYSQLEEEQREMRVLVEGVMEGHQSSKEAKQRIQETKHAIGEGVLLVEVCVCVENVCAATHDGGCSCDGVGTREGDVPL